MSAKWVEISTECERERFTALSASLSETGFANTVEFVDVEPGAGETAVREALQKYDQIRVGGALCEELVGSAERLPASVLTVRSIDAIVHDGTVWWPRNFLMDGALHSLVSDVKTFDLTGGVFILGASPEARAVIAALIRIGFRRFSICDPSDAKGQAFTGELTKVYFQVKFQPVRRQLITQLPSTHSVAVNTVRQGRDDGAIGELFYFNFLKPGGVWLDMPLKESHASLEAEAKAVSAFVEPGLRVFAAADVAWAKVAFGVDLDFETHSRRLGAEVSR